MTQPVAILRYYGDVVDDAACRADVFDGAACINLAHYGDVVDAIVCRVDVVDGAACINLALLR